MSNLEKEVKLNIQLLNENRDGGRNVGSLAIQTSDVAASPRKFIGL
jgi:hypothetical protein